MWVTLLLACNQKIEPTDGTSPPPPACAELLPEGALALDPDGPDTQIHVDAAFDGERVWVVWNRPDDQGLFDVWAGAFACDGTVAVAPVQVDDSDDNEIDPSVAVRDGRVVVAWQSDNSVFPDNLDVRWRVLDADGAPLGPVQEVDTPMSAWMPAIAPSVDGFVIAGSRSNGAVFEGFLLALGADGAPVGSPSGLGTDPGGGEFWPSVDSAGGATWVAFEGDDGVTLVPPTGAPETWGPGVAPSVSVDEDGPWVAFGDGAGDLWLARSGGDATLLKGNDETHFSPSVSALQGQGGHVAWYTNLGGLSNRVKVGRFDADGVLLDTVDVGTRTAAPYGLHLVRVDAETVFVGWAEGASPAFRAYGTFVTLP